MAAAIKHMASNFAKLEKFKGVDFQRWKKKMMHFLLSSMSVVYVMTTPMPEDGGDNSTVEQVKQRAKWDNNDYVCRGLILNGMSNPCLIFTRLLKLPKNYGIPWRPNIWLRYNDNKGKRKHQNTKDDPNKKPKMTCWKCGKPGHLKKDCKAGNVGNKANGSGTKGSGDGSSNSLKVQTSSAGASLSLSSGNLSSLAVGKWSGSGNSSLAVGMP
nr:zinc finger, CCHC-type [Tanacetum cinerariifolium]